MKKVILLIICIILFSGCTVLNKINQPTTNSNIVPFLTYYSEGNKVFAKLSYWDIDRKQVDLTDQLIYTAIPTVINDNVEPVAWDGGARIVLHDTSYSSAAFKDNSKIIKDYSTNNVWGKDIEMKINRDPSGIILDYELSLNTYAGTVLEKADLSLKTKDDRNNDIVIGNSDVPCAIDFNKMTGTVTCVFKYIFETYTSIYIAKFNIDEVEKVSWDTVRLLDESFAPYPNNSILLGSKYYIQSERSLTEINLNTLKINNLDTLIQQCRQLMPEGSFIPESPISPMPVGAYGDILIIRLPVYTDTNVEYLFCAFRDDNFLGAIHIKENEVWDIIEVGGDVGTNIDLRNQHIFKSFGLDLIIFPFFSNVM